MSRLNAVLNAAAAVVIGAALLSGCDQNPQVVPAGLTTVPITSTVTPTTVTTTEITETTTLAPPPPVTTQVAAPPPTAPETHSQTACGSDQYRDVDGVCVDRPRTAPSPPAGATAKCDDGTYSFSKHRQGTCSGHGGVASWL